MSSGVNDVTKEWQILNGEMVTKCELNFFLLFLPILQGLAGLFVPNFRREFSLMCADLSGIALQWRPCAISSVQVTPHKLP